MLERGPAGASSGRFVSWLDAWLVIMSSSLAQSDQDQDPAEVGDPRSCLFGNAVGGWVVRTLRLSPVAAVCALGTASRPVSWINTRTPLESSPRRQAPGRRDTARGAAERPRVDGAGLYCYRSGGEWKG